MKKTGLRVALYSMAAVVIIAIGCSDNGIQNKSSKVSDFVNTFVNDNGTSPNTNATYTLTVDFSPLEGGMVARNPNKDSYRSGAAVKVTAAPKAGYEFIGWSGAINDTNFEITITMNGDKRLTAGFKREGDDRPTYDVYFNMNGANGNAPEPARMISGNSITLPDQASMEKPGCNFVGWSENRNGTGTVYEGNTSYIVTHGVTLYAKWLPIYTVTFNTNNAAGGKAPAAVTTDSGTTIPLPDKGNMTREGYNFSGWSTSSYGAGDDYGIGANYTVTNNITLYARWNEITTLPEYGVAYDGNENTGGSTANTAVQYKQGTTINLRGKGSLERAGYSFEGWCIDRSCNGITYPASSSYTVTGDVVFYAKWVVLPNYTVTFNRNGATGESPASAGTYSGDSITLPYQGNMEKDGFRFGGWNTEANGTGARYAAGSYYTVKQNVTLFATWTVIKKYTVTYSGNGTTNGVPDAVSDVDSGSTIILPEQWGMERSGYRVDGWNTSSNGAGNNYAAGSYYTVTRDVTLFAKWTAIKKYTVTYSGNGTTIGVPGAVSDVDSGSTITLPDQGDMERSGNRFGGWNTNPSGSGTDYAAGSSYTVTRDVTLFAKWTMITYTLIIERNPTNGGTTNQGQSGIPEGKSFTISAKPAKDYRFTGWTLTSGNGSILRPDSAVTSVIVNGDMTVTANFELLQYTVTVISAGTGAYGSGIYSVGQTVNISAGTAPAGQQFKNWTISGNSKIADVNNAVTTVTMYGNVTVTANFYNNPNPQRGSATLSGNTLRDNDDGKTYRTVVIGGKRWMAENLNYQTPSGSWCYDNNTSYCNMYGRLYNWATAMEACPTGWHLPSKEEWDHLAESVGGTKSSDNWLGAGRTLKAQNGWNDYYGNNGNGTDSYGFSALPGGQTNHTHDEYGTLIFVEVGYTGIWWTATEYPNGTVDPLVYGWSMRYYGDDLSSERTYVDLKGIENYPNRYSVRCVQN